MRIDPTASIARLAGIRPKGTASEIREGARAQDTVELSARAEDLRVALAALRETPGVREDLVAELRRQIETGSFDVRPEDVARKLFRPTAASDGDE